jgi:signal transduction histidine kinase
MKRLSAWLNIDATSLRLALSYLAIIMVLSVGFSVIFYGTSTSNLHVRMQDPKGGGMSINDGSANASFPPDFKMGVDGGFATPDTAIPMLNYKLQQRFSEIRTGLMQQLVLLNIGALVLGGGLSFYLARRTLRPIEAAMESQSRFASDASHELRTPLTIMQTEIEVVLNKKDLSIERAIAALRSNYQEVTRLKQLSEGLLTLSQTPLAGTILSTVALDEIANEAVNDVLKLAHSKHIDVNNTLPKLTASGEAQSLIRVLVILLDNAIKFSPPKSTIHIDGKADSGQVFLNVRDEGPGIRATDLPHIFERFYRADPSRSRQNAEGYGLGLAIAKNIIEQHGGELSAASTLGQGATFTIKLPISRL